MDDPEDTRFTLSFDLLFHGLEITTGGQRIHDYNALLKKIEDRGMETEGMELNLRNASFNISCRRISHRLHNNRIHAANNDFTLSPRDSHGMRFTAKYDIIFQPETARKIGMPSKSHKTSPRPNFRAVG